MLEYRRIPKGGLFIDTKDVDNNLMTYTKLYKDRHNQSESLCGEETIRNHRPGVVNEPLFNVIRDTFQRAKEDTPITFYRKPIKLYTSIRETEHTNLIVYDKCILKGEYPAYPQGFLYDGSTTIESYDCENFYDLIMLSAFETLNAVVDKELVRVADIRKDYVSHSTPLPIGACYLNDCYVVVTTLAIHMPYFARLSVSLNEKYDIMPLYEIKDMLLNNSVCYPNMGALYELFASMNEIKGGKDHES